MSKFHQHYYTWSTKSISSNKVGLGLVASSTIGDNAYHRVIENLAGNCSICRGRHITVEKLVYSSELNTFVKMGATPCDSGADMRSNKFVHSYSYIQDSKEQLNPKEYLSPNHFISNYEGEGSLPIAQHTNHEFHIERILEKYQLKDKLPRFLQMIYHCICSGARPLSMVHPEISIDEFGEFSRDVMYLIHEMLPISFRKQAGYISYANEDIMESNFIFRSETSSKYSFNFLEQEMNNPIEESSFEQVFFQTLGAEFVKNKTGYQLMMGYLEEFILALKDTQNLLNKLIWFYYGELLKKQKERIPFSFMLEGLDNLIYWGKKEERLAILLDSILAAFPYETMSIVDTQNLLLKLMSGNQGFTKDIVYSYMSKMLQSIYDHDKEEFLQMVKCISEKNSDIYEVLILMNMNSKKQFGYAMLFLPIETVEELEDTVNRNKRFFKSDRYREYVVDCAYRIYTSNLQLYGSIVQDLMNQVDLKLFLSKIMAGIFQVMQQYKTLYEILDYLHGMNLDTLDQTIRRGMFQYAKEILYMNKIEYETICQLEQIGILLNCKEELHYILKSVYEDIVFSVKSVERLYERYMEFGSKNNKNIAPYIYEQLRILTGRPDELTDRTLFSACFMEKNLKETIGITEKSNLLREQEIRSEIERIKMFGVADFFSYKIKGKLGRRIHIALMNKYQDFFDTAEKKSKLFEYDITTVFHTIITITSPFCEGDRKVERTWDNTRQLLLQKNNIYDLYDANEILREKGKLLMPCPRSFWDQLDIMDFIQISQKITDISLCRNNKSDVSLGMEILLHYEDNQITKKDETQFESIFQDDKHTADGVIDMAWTLWTKDVTRSFEFLNHMLNCSKTTEERFAYLFEQTKTNEKLKKELTLALRKIGQGKEYTKYICHNRDDTDSAGYNSRTIGRITCALIDLFQAIPLSFLLGGYGFLLIAFRELNMYKEGYIMSFVIIVIACIFYLLRRNLIREKGYRTRQIPMVICGAILIINIGLALDTPMSRSLFFLGTGIAAAVSILTHMTAMYRK